MQDYTIKWGRARSPQERSPFPMINISEAIADFQAPHTRPSTAAQTQALGTRRSAYPIGEAKYSRSATLAAPHRRYVPRVFLDLAPRPPLAYDDNPLFNEASAARFLGISAECIKKWRQRNQGPNYLQYGPGGPVRYELNTLIAFWAAHKITVGGQP
jgi:hypothetical protein